MSQVKSGDVRTFQGVSVCRESRMSNSSVLTILGLIHIAKLNGRIWDWQQSFYYLLSQRWEQKIWRKRRISWRCQMCAWLSNVTLCWLNKEDRTCCSPIWELSRYVALFLSLSWVYLSGFSINTHENQVRLMGLSLDVDFYVVTNQHNVKYFSNLFQQVWGFFSNIVSNSIIYLGKVLRILSWWEGFSQPNGNKTHETKWKEKICNDYFYDSKI